MFMCKLTKPASEVLTVYPIGDFWKESAASMSRAVDEVREDIFEREGSAFDVDMFAAAGSSPVAEGDDLDCLKD